MVIINTHDIIMGTSLIDSIRFDSLIHTMPDKKPDNNKFKLARQMGIAVTIPMTLLAGPLVGWFAGSWLDGKFGTKPWFLVILLALGTIAGVRQTIKMIKDISRDDDDGS